MKAAFYCEGLKAVYSVLARKMGLLYIIYEALIRWQLSSVCVVSGRKRSISPSVRNFSQFELAVLLPRET
jgi:hypothetical protein